MRRSHCRPFSLALIAAFLLATPALSAQGQDREFVQYPDWEDPHFSRLVIVGDTIYLSGAIGMGADFQVVPGGIQAETRQALENIRDSLAEVGAGMDDIVKCTVFLTDMSDWVSMNAVYKTFFTADRRPARSAFAAKELSLHAKVEIDCIAVRSPTAEGDR